MAKKGRTAVMEPPPEVDPEEMERLAEEQTALGAPIASAPELLPTEIATRDRIVDTCMLRQEAEIQGRRLGAYVEELQLMASLAESKERSAALANRMSQQLMLFPVAEEATLEVEWERLRAVNDAIESLKETWNLEETQE